MGEVYKLTDGVLNYYGSTKKRAIDRFWNHKSNKGCASNQLDETKITYEVMEVVVGSGELLREREQYYIDNYECVNIANAYRSEETRKRQNVVRQQAYRELHNLKQYRVQCECGSNVRKLDIRTHERTKKHINYINSL
tara:strand:- start:467 stop:880 length:414 start_codon:yes stop_codon:yes gene_type:complete